MVHIIKEESRIIAIERICSAANLQIVTAVAKGLGVVTRGIPMAGDELTCWAFTKNQTPRAPLRCQHKKKYQRNAE